MIELTLDDLFWAEDQLKRLTYKPGWAIRMIDPPSQFADPSIQIEFCAEDTYWPGRQTIVMSRYTFPQTILSTRDEQKFARYLLDLILRVERHEAQEWLKRDGVVLFDPHKD